jgi:hypothetical protein
MVRSDVSDATRQKALPFATTGRLLQHANQILERLDHEYSAYGGLLGIMPVPEDEENQATRLLGEKTILGQWIAFTRALTLRCHDLEISYARALDVVAGEAVVPREALSELGTLGRQPQKVGAQDRFVLCNVKQGEWAWLNDRLAEKEEEDNQKPANTDMMTFVEVPTRYYRLKGQETVFVVPQWDGTYMTTQIEQRPTVVQVVKPQWGVRASEWEEKHEADIQRLRSYEPELLSLRRQNKDFQEDIEVLAQEKKHLEVESQLWHATEKESTKRAWVEEKLEEVEKYERKLRDLEARDHDFAKRKANLVRLEMQAEEQQLLIAQEWRKIEASKQFSPV